MNRAEALALFQAHRGRHEELGVRIWGARSYLPDEYRRNSDLALDALGIPSGVAFDAQAGTLSTDPNSAVPAILTTYIDPQVYEIQFAPNAAALVLPEERKGDWTTDTTMFPVVEHTGEVSSYGDRNENGSTGVNTNWPQFQSYIFQTILEYGERELERAGLAKINWVSEITRASATVMNKYMNFTYLFGVKGLQNYGITNDPTLPAALTPAAKAAGGVTWFVNGAPNATANEVYNDVISLFEALVNANQGLIDKDSKLCLVLSPGSAVALTFTNSFNVNVEDLLKKNFKNLRVQTVPQYGVSSTTNPQGIAGGNLVQLIAEEVEGQRTGFCGFNEKMRTHKIIPHLSSWRQKVTGGSWGAVIRYPAGFAQMLGV